MLRNSTHVNSFQPPELDHLALLDGCAPVVCVYLIFNEIFYVICLTKLKGKVRVYLNTRLLLLLDGVEATALELLD